MEFAGVLMAGGKSSRMKQDKGFVLWEGEMMASYGLKILQATCDSCFISTNNSDYEIFNLPLLKDVHKDIGPMGGLHSALTNSPFNHVLLLGCDMPNISLELIRELQLNCKTTDAVIPLHGDGKLEPLVGIYSKSILPLLEDMIRKKDYRMNRLLSLANTNYVDVDYLALRNPELFSNINTLDQVC